MGDILQVTVCWLFCSFLRRRRGKWSMRSTTFPLAFPTKRAKSATDFPTKGGRGLFILLQHQEGRNKTVAVACMVAQQTGSAGGRGLLGCTRLTPRPSPGPVGSAPSFVRACSRGCAWLDEYVHRHAQRYSCKTSKASRSSTVSLLRWAVHRPVTAK